MAPRAPSPQRGRLSFLIKVEPKDHELPLRPLSQMSDSKGDGKRHPQPPGPAPGRRVAARPPRALAADDVSLSFSCKSSVRRRLVFLFQNKHKRKLFFCKEEITGWGQGHDVYCFEVSKDIMECRTSTTKPC